MAIDILSIKPSVVSRDLRGKFVMVYGKPKAGKTSMAASFPKTLLLAFERGYNALGGIYAVDMLKWSDLKQVIRQLDKPEAHEIYETICIDTIAIAWDLCSQYICAQNGVENLSDIPWGKGWTLLRQEFETTLRKITQLGYGLVLIAHSKTKLISTTNEKGEEISHEYISPQIPDRAAEICNGLVDVIGYVSTEFDENGNSVRYLYTRPTPSLFAGSRFKYLAPKIPFGYQALVDAIGDSIEMEQRLDGIKVVDNGNLVAKADNLNYEDLMNEARDLWSKLTSGHDDETNQATALKILDRIETIMGRRMKLSEFTESQTELLALVVSELRDLNK